MIGVCQKELPLEPEWLEKKCVNDSQASNHWVDVGVTITTPTITTTNRITITMRATIALSINVTITFSIAITITGIF